MKWQFWIDRGGTFTDIVAQNPSGDILAHKLLSENPESYKDAAIQAIRDLMNVGKNQPIPVQLIDCIKMGTTVATNALLERKGEPTLLVINKGFGDALEIGYQNRKDIFARHIIKPEMLYSKVVQVDARVRADGFIDRNLNPNILQLAKTQMQSAYNNGIDAVAIVLMHAYKYPQYELDLKAVAEDIGFAQISVSHQVSPLMKIVGRGDTTVVDAYLSPILRRYVKQIEDELTAGNEANAANNTCKLMFMQSSGGLTAADLFQGKDAILSGPAGGVVGATQTSILAGFNNIIGFDMGGTSTDVSHYNGELERAFETEVAGVRMRAPMMNIHTVAAGGGSLLTYDGTRFRVGPQSAGANPGPACYRRGGDLALTDANVMLGKLSPKYFPAIFGQNQDKALDEDVVAQKFEALAAKINDGKSAADVAEGFLRIAIENMSEAIKKISVERGYDVSDYALTSFGGAGGQHACLVADSLGMDKIFLHTHSGILSAYGMGLADIRASLQKSIELELTAQNFQYSQTIIAALAQDVSQKLAAQDVAKTDISVDKKLQLKYAGSDSTLQVKLANIPAMQAEFEHLHTQQFGFISPEKTLIIESVNVEAYGGGAQLHEQTYPLKTGEATAIDNTKIFSQGQWHSAQIFDKQKILAGQTVTGPALIIEEHGTISVEFGWQAKMNAQNHLILTRVIARQQLHAIGTQADPVMLEIFNNLFMSIAEQMGVRLENTASSVNIKERLDFSCAVFDPTGALIANAPHMPVHLGSMDRSVQSIIKQNPVMNAGDVYMLNNPYNGGTHLPDITVVTPIFNADETAILFYVASRGHHADIGGKAPGSMTPDAKTLDEEGILINNFKLVDMGVFQEAKTRALLADNPYPARNINMNIADLKAQIAANEKGISELRRMVAHFSFDVVKAYMQHVQDNAEANVRRVIASLNDCSFTYEMDQGTQIAVKISIDKTTNSATVDFSGTSKQQNNNFNAPEPVTRAAVLYVFRCLVDDDIPMNAGCLKPINIIIPDGCMLKPLYPAAVVAGNVETSQAVTDALFGALGILAAAQGTMNNLTFGNDKYQYYETICGGSGAGRDHNGTSAIHTHMTNSRLTDPEILEHRYPVMLQSYEIMRNSGGKGKFNGGDGTLRKIKFLQKMQVSLLTGHRRIPPFGLEGGDNGKCGQNSITRATGKVEILNHCDQTYADIGDILTIKTPSGGGFGSKNDR
ncbi:MAG: hydantoinase B/oxoprolinase family protein [Hyphomicrobiales bacterium]|nr:hydantoinase B/oxoprolinase family protein [Hyphomicrobiales bacterium]